MQALCKHESLSWFYSLLDGCEVGVLGSPLSCHQLCVNNIGSYAQVTTTSFVYACTFLFHGKEILQRKDHEIKILS
jgi:hypothetical protein